MTSRLWHADHKRCYLENPEKSEILRICSKSMIFAHVSKIESARIWTGHLPINYDMSILHCIKAMSGGGASSSEVSETNINVSQVLGFLNPAL